MKAVKIIYVLLLLLTPVIGVTSELLDVFIKDNPVSDVLALVTAVFAIAVTVLFFIVKHDLNKPD